MKTIIFLDSNLKDREFLSFHWEEHYEVNLINARSEVDAVRSLLSQPITERILIAKDIENSKESHLKEYLENYPETVVITNTAYTGLKADTKDIKNFFCAKEFGEMMKSIGISRVFDNGDYYKVKLFNFLQFSVAITDIYIKLGKDHYVKIINEGELLTKDILDKYRGKKIEYLYIENNQITKFMNEMSQLLSSFFERPNKSENVAKELQIAAIENLNYSLRSIGISDGSVELANKTISSVMQTIKRMDSLWRYIQEKSKTGTFLSEHCLSTAALACIIVDGVEWKTDFTLEKVVMASLLHDIALDRDHLSYIRLNTESAYVNLSIEEKELVLNHPLEACNILDQFPELPANVCDMIREHHERPDGSGFPKGLNSLNITPLSCALILAEEFFHLLYKNGFTIESRNIALEEMGEQFSRGNFKPLFNSLVSSFLKGGQ